MRQNLLLIAGWAVVAVGSSLVSSAAVAAVGGQVGDQPLRPLTAAEVAALPVVAAADFSVPSESLASGDIVSTTGESAVGAGDRITRTGAPGPAGEEGDPLVPGAVGTTTDVPLPSSQPDATDVPGLATPVTGQVVRALGGSVSLVVTDGAVRFLWATPRPGYLVGVRNLEEGGVMVTFSGLTRRSVVEAAPDSEGLEVTVREIDRQSR